MRSSLFSMGIGWLVGPAEPKPNPIAEIAAMACTCNANNTAGGKPNASEESHASWSSVGT
jgi:hypothetical protein